MQCELEVNICMATYVCVGVVAVRWYLIVRSCASKIYETYKFVLFNTVFCIRLDVYGIYGG